MNKSLEPPARLQFLTGWQTVKHGSIRPGGRLIIDYDICRPQNLQTRFRDIIFWQVQAFVRFHPSGQLDTGSVIGGNFDDGGRRPFKGHCSKPFEFVVPRDATRVEIWFRLGCKDAGRPDDVAWDSRFGQNYWFDVIHTQTDKRTDRNRRLSQTFDWTWFSPSTWRSVEPVAAMKMSPRPAGHAKPPGNNHLRSPLRIPDL
jgi:Family of unknown function (DUF6209)